MSNGLAFRLRDWATVPRTKAVPHFQAQNIKIYKILPEDATQKSIQSNRYEAKYIPW